MNACTQKAIAREREVLFEKRRLIFVTILLTSLAWMFVLAMSLNYQGKAREELGAMKERVSWLEVYSETEDETLRHLQEQRRREIEAKEADTVRQLKAEELKRKEGRENETGRQEDTGDRTGGLSDPPNVGIRTP